MINTEIIKERLKEMDENLKLLEELKTLSLNELIKDPKSYKACERCLEICIQCILDICHHLIAGNNWRRPANNTQAIEIIASYGVIPQEFAKKISPMSKLRNILIHEYTKVDPSILYQHIQHLEDFYQFQKLIITYLSLM